MCGAFGLCVTERRTECADQNGGALCDLQTARMYCAVGMCVTDGWTDCAKRWSYV